MIELGFIGLVVGLFFFAGVLGMSRQPLGAPPRRRR